MQFFMLPDEIGGAYSCRFVRPSVRPDACPEHNSKVNEANLMKLCIYDKYVKAECSVQ